jgi:hypothetical protein
LYCGLALNCCKSCEFDERVHRCMTASHLSAINQARVLKTGGIEDDNKFVHL